MELWREPCASFSEDQRIGDARRGGGCRVASSQKTWCPDSVKVEPRSWLESYWGCGVVSSLPCDRPLSRGRRKPFHAGVWMPPTWGWGSISRLSLGHHLWPWHSGPQNKDRVSQMGASLELTGRHPPFGGNCFWERETRHLCPLPPPSLLGSCPLPAATTRGAARVTAVTLSTAWKEVNRGKIEEEAEQLLSHPLQASSCPPPPAAPA